MSPGWVLFQLGSQTLAVSLDAVREIVRLERIEPLPGTRPPMAGVIVLRGSPLPVYDVRDAGAASGDVLVISVDGDPLGMAVDRVAAVVSATELPESAEPPARSLPDYVVGVRRNPVGPVLIVDPALLLDACAGGWAELQTDFTPVSSSR
jgi:chemotaxis signal transduction protein